MPPQVLHLKSTLALRTIIKAVKIKKKYNLCQPKIVQSLKLESKKTNRDKWSKFGSNLRRTLLTSLSRRKSLKTTGRTLTLLQASRRGVHSKRKNLRICQESPFTQQQLKTQLQHVKYSRRPSSQRDNQLFSKKPLKSSLLLIETR